MTARRFLPAHLPGGEGWIATKPVYEDVKEGPIFDEDTWTLAALPDCSSTARNLHFGSLSETWKPVVKAVIWLCLNPRSDEARNCRVKHLPYSRNGVVGLLSRLRRLSDYFSSGHYPSSGRPPSSLVQADFLRILNDAQDRAGVFSTRNMKSARAVLKELERLYLLGEYLPGGGIREVPFAGWDIDAVMKLPSCPTNLTSVIPWAQFDAFCSGAWTLVDEVSREILPNIEVEAAGGQVRVVESWSVSSSPEPAIRNQRPGKLRAQGTFMVRLLQTAALVTIARSTLMRPNELFAIPSSGAVVLEGGRPYVRSRQFKGVKDPQGRPRLWIATDRVVRAVEVAEKLAGDSPTLVPSGVKPTIQGMWLKRLFGFLAVAPNLRLGGGRELGHDRSALEEVLVSYDERGDAEIDLTRVGKPDAELGFRTLRQTGADYLGRRSGGELALASQLGHSNLRTSKGYVNGGGGVVKTQWNDYQRRKLTADFGPELLNDPLGGAAGRQIKTQRRLLRTEDAQAQFLEHVVDRLYLGHACHCAWDPAKAVCNPGGEAPLLRVGVCATLDCANALLTSEHTRFWQLEIEKLLAALERNPSAQRREYYLAQLSAARDAVNDLGEADVAAE